MPRHSELLDDDRTHAHYYIKRIEITTETKE